MQNMLVSRSANCAAGRSRDILPIGSSAFFCIKYPRMAHTVLMIILISMTAIDMIHV